MSSSALLGATTLVYLASSVAWAMYLLFRQRGLHRAAVALCVLGMVAHTGGMVLRWLESHRMGIGHVPLANFYESLVVFAWAVAGCCLWMDWHLRTREAPAFAIPFAFLILAYASFGTESRIEPLVPALQSNWLLVHVATCFLGYGAFAASCGVSLWYLLSKSPSRQLEELIHKLVMLGFPFLTAGIITGAIWAHFAWGRYWGWDPKETWSLITWFIYAAFLHARFVRRWRGRRMAVLSLLGFAAVLFTYLGVNFLLRGLHSYV